MKVDDKLIRKRSSVKETNNLNAEISATSLDGTDLFSTVTKIMLGFFNKT